MRIVHVVRQFHPAVGGLENFVWELSCAQVACGHSVRVVTLDRLFNVEQREPLAQREELEGFEVVRIPFFGSRRYPIAPSVIKHVGDADILHVHGIDFFFDYLAITAPWHRRTLIVSTHGGFFHTKYAAYLKRIYFALITRLALTRYAGVAAVSSADHALFGRVRSHGLALIENGVNVAKFAGAAAPTPKKAMIAIGRFASNKRLDRLIAMIAALRRRDPQWTLVIAGRAWDQTPEDIIAAAAVAGVADAVQVLASPSDAAIRQAMTNCSVFVGASDYEGFGITAVEGLSAGLFPLLNDIPPFARLVRRVGVGMIADFADPEAAAAQFARQWEEIALDYQRYRDAALSAAALYSWTGASQEYESLYNSAVGNNIRSILDVGVRAISSDAAVALLDDRFARRETTPVTFANAHTLNTATADGRLRNALRQSIVFNDGIGVDIASRLLFGKPFPDNLNGTDFVPSYLTHTRHQYRIFLLGASPGIAERAAERLAKFSPQHHIVGCRHGYLDPADAPRVAAEIRASLADVLLVGMGNPTQELWLMEHLAETGCRLGFAVGALLDFMAGRFPRAPEWMRELRIEWVYRLVQEPLRLWRRYLLGNPLFLMRIIAQWFGGSRIPAAQE
jgi:alpha-1,3-mannosyltransferase